MLTEQTSEWGRFLPKVVIEQAGYGAVWRGVATGCNLHPLRDLSLPAIRSVAQA
jgi:hypothetical protein